MRKQCWIWIDEDVVAVRRVLCWFGVVLTLLATVIMLSLLARAFSSAAGARNRLWWCVLRNSVGMLCHHWQIVGRKSSHCSSCPCTARARENEPFFPSVHRLVLLWDGYEPVQISHDS